MVCLSLGSGASRLVAIACVLALVLASGCAADGPYPDDAPCSEDGECASDFCAGLCLQPDGDADGDGISNSRERELGLNLFSADTDGDGFSDGLEGEVDTDGDGRIDALESAFADSDGDCIVDSLDADDARVNKDLALLAALMCRNRGVCAQLPPHGPTATCTASVLLCDYSAVAGWEAEIETSCDGLDNDCDGDTDEDFVYVDASFAVATIGDPCFGVGACATHAGVVHCDAAGDKALCSVNAGGSAFQGEPFDVNCDGIDNDCDGETDEEIVWRDPVDGALLTAGSACRALGACGLSFGIVECSEDGEIGLCSTGPGGGDDRSRAEICNGIDDDCDGRVDEDLVYLPVDGGEPQALGAACGLGQCAGGQVICAGDGAVTCSSDGRATAEVCNGLDDDCDGATDELSDVRDMCPIVGVCGQSLLLSGRCDGAVLVCRYEDGTLWRSGQPEAHCDERDDDCDGLTDEDFMTRGGLPAGAACVGVGACAGAVGVVICGDDGLSVRCTTNAAQSPEVCDGIDNDCNGLTDDGPLADADHCVGVGVCAADGLQAGVCEAGLWRCHWEDAPEFEQGIESRCDGRDNDCDGWTDEGLLGHVTGEQRALVGPVLAPGEVGQLTILGDQEASVIAFAAKAPEVFWRWGPEAWSRWTFLSAEASPVLDPRGALLARGAFSDGWWYAELSEGEIGLWTLTPVGLETARWELVERQALNATPERASVASLGRDDAGRPFFAVVVTGADQQPETVIWTWDGDGGLAAGEVLSGRLVAGYVVGAELRVVTILPLEQRWRAWRVASDLGLGAVARAPAEGALPAAAWPLPGAVGVASQEAVFAHTASGRVLRWGLRGSATFEARAVSSLDEGVSAWLWLEAAGLLSTHSAGGPLLTAWPLACAEVP